MIHIDGDDQICIHVAGVTIDHQVGMLPKVPGAIAFADGASGGILFRNDHRTGLQTIAVFVLDGVLLVIEHRVQSLVQVGNVIATVEIVIHEHFPVAGNVVGAPIKVVQFRDAQWRNAPNETAEKFCKRRGVTIQVNEDETFPSLHANGNKAILRSIEILYAFEFGHAFQRAIEAVVPSMIGTVEKRGVATRLRYDCGGVVAAHIVKGPQDTVSATNHHNGLAGDRCGNELAGSLNLIGARNQLPCLAENVQPLELGNAGIDIPGRRNR